MVISVTFHHESSGENNFQMVLRFVYHAYSICKLECWVTLKSQEVMFYFLNNEKGVFVEAEVMGICYSLRRTVSGS